jgi:glycosyltransferase involved in cell wall biosynthesis
VDLSLRYLLANQIKHLQGLGYDVVGISNPGPDVPWLNGQGIRHIPVNMTRTFSPLKDLSSLVNLVAILQRGRFDIVHTHNPKPGLIGQLAARAAGVPLVINTLHGFYFHEHTPPIWRRFYITTEKIAARQSSAILSQNPDDIATAVEEGICDPDQIRLLGNGIDLSRFDPTTISADEHLALQRNLGIEPGDLVVGFVGRLVAEKGIHDLMRAISLLRGQFPNLKVLLVGPLDAEKKDALHPDFVKDHGLEDICIFTGMRQDMPALYGLMDVFCLPSHREGFPRSPQEAAAMKVPAVVADIRGSRETVVDGETGRFFPVRDHRALARTLGEVLHDENLRWKMGQAARDFAERKFDEKRVFDIVAETYAKELAKIGRKPPDPKIQKERRRVGPGLYAA